MNCAQQTWEPESVPQLPCDCWAWWPFGGHACWLKNGKSSMALTPGQQRSSVNNSKTLETLTHDHQPRRSSIGHRTSEGVEPPLKTQPLLCRSAGNTSAVCRKARSQVTYTYTVLRRGMKRKIGINMSDWSLLRQWHLWAVGLWFPDVPHRTGFMIKICGCEENEVSSAGKSLHLICGAWPEYLLRPSS